MIRRRNIARWLVHCADPLGREYPPPRVLSPAATSQLVAEADGHGILPSLLRHYPFPDTEDYAAAKADAGTRRAVAATFVMMLRHYGGRIGEACAGLPATVVKGWTFASTIYPDPALRPFTDIDILAAPEAHTRINGVLQDLGFKFADFAYVPGRQEAKWTHSENDALIVEVHGNMVHAPSLRKTMSLSYEDLREDAESPAGFMCVAALHGGLHHFERLRHVADILQAARALTSAQDEQRLAALLEKSGARLSAITGLRLAHRLFGEPRCLEIARGLGRERYTHLAGWLIGPSLVTSTMSSSRFVHSWRRQAFRELLKRGRPRPRSARHLEERELAADAGQSSGALLNTETLT
jgi:hypothetical protein